MRTLTLTALALGAAACSGGDALHLEYRSTLWNETRGVVLYDDGTDLGHGAMLDTTCEFDLATGEVTGDLDLPTASEVVTDVRDGQVLARSAEGVHVLEHLTWNPENDVRLTNVIDAAFGPNGPASLQAVGDDCVLHGLGDSPTSVGACTIDANLLVDDTTGRAWIADRGILSEVTDTGLVEVATADLASFDRSTRSLIIASGGDVAKLWLNGDLQWRVQVDDTVTSIDDLGQRDGAAIVTASSELVLIGSEGQTRSRERLPSPAKVAVSNDGRNLALVTGEQTNFYSIESGGRRFEGVERAPVENPFSD